MSILLRTTDWCVLLVVGMFTCLGQAVVWGDVWEHRVLREFTNPKKIHYTVRPGLEFFE